MPKKNKTENTTMEIKMNNLDIQTNVNFPGIKFRIPIYQEHGYGTSQLVQILDETQLQDMFN